MRAYAELTPLQRDANIVRRIARHHRAAIQALLPPDEKERLGNFLWQRGYIDTTTAARGQIDDSRIPQRHDRPDANRVEGSQRSDKSPLTVHEHVRLE
jgi:hypothetical protein